MTGFFPACPPHPVDLVRLTAVRLALDDYAVSPSGDMTAQIVAAAHSAPEAGELPEFGRLRAVNTVLRRRAVYLPTDKIGKIVAASRLCSGD